MSGSLHFQDGRTVAVVDGLVLGRSPDCGVVVEDEKTSRHHARFVVQVGVVEIEDLGSRNGTLLNGNRVTKRVVRDGDVITVGLREMTYRDAARASAPAASSGPSPGDDLFGDEPGDEAAVEPEVAPRATPVQPPTPPVRPVEVLEFADDDVVEVRTPSAPARVAAPSPPRAPAKPGGAGANRVGGVLQFSARPDKKGALAGDVSQLGGAVKAGIVLLAIAVAAGLGWLVMNFVSG